MQVCLDPLRKSFATMATNRLTSVISLGPAPDFIIGQYAQDNQMSLITGDTDFGNILDYPPEHYFGIILIERPPGLTVGDALNLVEQFLIE